MSRIYFKTYKIENFKNKHISNWYITGETKKNTNNQYYWECVCKCGRKQWVRSSSLVRNESKGCASCSHALNDNFHQVKSWYFSQIKNKAKKREIVCNVSIEYLQGLWREQNGKCALSGLPIVLSTKFGTIQTASLDRIDSSKGYVEGNLQWLHNDVNKMKLHHPQKKFIQICREICTLTGH